MKDLVTVVASMTSREIAELTGKRHDNVVRDIDVILKEISSDLRNGFKSSTYVDAGGREYRQYILDKDSTLCLIAGYDVTARMRIIKRWQQLEELARPERVVGFYLLDKPAKRPRLISAKFMELVCRMHNYEFVPERGCPPVVCGLLHKTIYTLMPTSVYAELKRRRREHGTKYYASLVQAAYDMLASTQGGLISKIEGMLIIAAEFKSPKLFMRLWNEHFGNKQLSIGFDITEDQTSKVLEFSNRK